MGNHNIPTARVHSIRKINISLVQLSLLLWFYFWCVACFQNSTNEFCSLSYVYEISFITVHFQNSMVSATWFGKINWHFLSIISSMYWYQSRQDDKKIGAVLNIKNVASKTTKQKMSPVSLQSYFVITSAGTQSTEQGLCFAEYSR